MVIPESLDVSGNDGTYSSTLLLHTDLAIDVRDWPHENGRRIIIELDKEIVRNSTFIFYFKHESDTATTGTQFRLNGAELFGSE